MAEAGRSLHIAVPSAPDVRTFHSHGLFRRRRVHATSSEAVGLDTPTPTFELDTKSEGMPSLPSPRTPHRVLTILKSDPVA